MPHQAVKRKLLVCGKPWDGVYDASRQDFGYTTYEHIKDVILTRPWSPILWRNGHRQEINFISSDWLVLDFDKHSMTLEQAKKSFSDYQNIISTTKSHTPDRHALRVCIPWAETITDLHVFNHNLRINADFYASDDNALTGSRFFWPSKKLYSVNTEGEFMAVEDAPHQRVFESIPLLRPPDPQIPDRIMPLFTDGLDEGERNARLWTAAKDLYREGFEWHDVRKIIERIPTRPAYRSRDFDAIVKSAKTSIEREERKARQNTASRT